MSKTKDAELLTQYLKTRDPVTREALIMRYVPLVHFVIGRLGVSGLNGIEYEDLVSHGLIGLINAVDRYDPIHGARISTYATLRIRGEILDYLRALDWLPREARKRARAVEDAVSNLWAKLHRAPTDEELSTSLNMEPKQLRKALDDANRLIISLDNGIHVRGEDPIPLYELIPDEDQNTPADIMIEDNLKENLVHAIKDLPQREQFILSLYYYEGVTMKEIGDVLNISESRVCQLHARSVMNLKASLREKEALPPSSGQTYVGNVTASSIGAG